MKRLAIPLALMVAASLLGAALWLAPGARPAPIPPPRAVPVPTPSPWSSSALTVTSP